MKENRIGSTRKEETQRQIERERKVSTKEKSDLDFIFVVAFQYQNSMSCLYVGCFSFMRFSSFTRTPPFTLEDTPALADRFYFWFSRTD